MFLKGIYLRVVKNKKGKNNGSLIFKIFYFGLLKNQNFIYVDD
jgi:hypothetical protein